MHFIKLFLIFIIFCCGRLLAQNSIYDLQVDILNGKAINMADFKGKKILIVLASPENLQKDEVPGYLDSIQAISPATVMIIIPASDFSDTVNTGTMEAISRTISQSMILGTARQVKKDKGNNQDQLCQWLTHADKNNHYDSDVTTDMQLYVISESGILFSVLEKGTPVSEVGELLKQQDVKQ